MWEQINQVGSYSSCPSKRPGGLSQRDGRQRERNKRFEVKPTEFTDGFDVWGKVREQIRMLMGPLA